MNIDFIRKEKLILFECISGSKAYGLSLSHSDTDLKGVFILPKKIFFGLEEIEQVANETNDIVFYELKRFFQLLLRNNPNILELLATPEDCVLYSHPTLESIKPDHFLSRLCNQTFAGYAYSQIKKAQGLNKKILNPIDQERKSVLDFCFVVQGQGSVPLQQWISEMKFKQEECGLVSVPHMRDVFALYHSSQFDNAISLRGIYSGIDANEVSLSPVPQGKDPLAIMNFNKDGYSKYCRDYKEYWTWVEERNDERYQNTLQHGKKYDAKNMMHVFRLLDMAEEIARYKKVNVIRPNREELLRIRRGEFLYEELLSRALEKIEQIRELFERSDLPDEPDQSKIEILLYEMREKIYNERDE